MFWCSCFSLISNLLPFRRHWREQKKETTKKSEKVSQKRKKNKKVRTKKVKKYPSSIPTHAHGNAKKHPQKRTEHRAQSTEHRAQSTEHRAQSTYLNCGSSAACFQNASSHFFTLILFPATMVDRGAPFLPAEL